MKTKLILAFGLFICFVAIDKTTNIEPVVFEELGVVLTSHGVVTKDADDLLISVFVKAPLPEWPLEEPCDRVVCTYDKRCKYCSLQHICTHNLTKEHWMSEKFQHVTLEYINHFHDISSGTFANISSSRSGRGKRFAGLLGIGLGALNLAFSGISTYKLNSKINELKDDFDKFKLTTHELKKDIIKLREGTIHLFDSFASQVNDKFAKLACSINSRIKALSHHQLLNAWERRLDRLFKYPLSGNIAGQLTPDMISTSHLREILEKHTELAELIYSENIVNFYATTIISMVEATIYQHNLNIHFVLHIPAIKRSTTFPLYKVRQVDINVNNSCYKTSVPSFVYFKTSGFYEMNVGNCKLGDVITNCVGMDTNSKTGVSCLTQPKTCQFINTKCSLKHIYTVSGILIGMANSVFGITVSNEVVQQHSNNLGTLFVPWKNLAHVQIDDTKFQAPSYSPSHIIVPSIDSDVRSIVVEKVNSTVEADKILPKINQQWPLKRKHNSILGIMATTIAIILSCTTIALLFKFYWPLRSSPEAEPSIENAHADVADPVSTAADAVDLPRN